MPTSIFPSSFPEAMVFLENFATVAQTNKEELGITDEQLTAIKAIKNKYQNDLNAKQAADDIQTAKNTAMRETHKDANSLVSFYNTTLKATKTISRSSLQQLGLNITTESSFATSSVMPTNVVAEGFSNGINKIKWKKGSNISGTQYIVEAKSGEATVFSYAGVTTKSTFEHKEQRPGVRTFYRVKAQRNDESSPYSNEAVVY
jgi:hypothetical protein